MYLFIIYLLFFLLIHLIMNWIYLIIYLFIYLFIYFFFSFITHGLDDPTQPLAVLHRGSFTNMNKKKTLSYKLYIQKHNLQSIMHL